MSEFRARAQEKARAMGFFGDDVDLLLRRISTIHDEMMMKANREWHDEMSIEIFNGQILPLSERVW